MKDYPSIQGASRGPHQPCYGFVKYDGSNIRIAWSAKQGWSKFGTRKLMFDKTSEHFGTVVELFHNKYASDLEAVFKKEKMFRGVREVTIFCEWFGASSFAGNHDFNEPKDIILFDVNPLKKGFMSPKDFLDHFGHLKVAECVYQGNLNTHLIQEVRKGTFDCISKYPIINKVSEGLVCKGGRYPHHFWMAKVKTQAWFDALKAFRPVDW